MSRAGGGVGGDKTDQPPISTLYLTIQVNVPLQSFFKQYLISFLMIPRLIDFALVVL